MKGLPVALRRCIVLVFRFVANYLFFGQTFKQVRQWMYLPLEKLAFLSQSKALFILQRMVEFNNRKGIYISLHHVQHEPL